jgi:hypothetical protein
MNRLRGVVLVFKDLINWIVPVAVLALAVLVWQISLPIALGIALVVFGGLYFVLNSADQQQALREASHAEVLQMLDGTKSKVQQIRALSKGVAKPDVRAKLIAICDIADRTSGELAAKNDTELSTASRFDFTFSQTLQIMQLYTQIQKGVVSAEPGKMKALTGKIENDILDQIKSSLQEFEVRLGRGDIVSLETAIDLLENTLKLEGLS